MSPTPTQAQPKGGSRKDTLNWQRARARLDQLASAGVEREDLYKHVSAATVERKQQVHTNRCRTCWHDKALRCICWRLEELALVTELPVKALILMHHKEYLNPGDDAKLLVGLLPAAQVTSPLEKGGFFLLLTTSSC